VEDLQEVVTKLRSEVEALQPEEIDEQSSHSRFRQTYSHHLAIAIVQQAAAQLVFATT